MAVGSVALLLALGSAVGFGASAAVRTETRAGLIATSGVQTSDPALDFVVTPAGSLTLSRGDTAFTLGYNVRLLRRFFVTEVDRFIILHGANAGFSDSFGRGWRLRANASASLGEVDYAGASTVIGGQAGTNGGTNTNTNSNGQTTSQGNVPNASIIPLLNLAGSAGVSGAIGRNHGVGVTLSVSQVRPLGTVAAGQQTFANTIGAGVGANYTYTITSRLGVSAASGINFTTFGGDGATQGAQNFRSGSGNVGLNYQFSASSGASVQVGALVSDGTNGFLASPTGSLSYSVNLSNTAALQLGGQIQTTIDGQANPITQSYDPRFSAQLSFGGRIGSDWSVRIDGQFTTPLPIDPSGGGTVTVDPAQNLTTFIGGGIPITYRINSALNAEFGVRAQAQGPRLDADMFAFISPSVTGYVALSASVATGP